MNPDEIICIIDRSGSMGAITSDAIGGFNSFLSNTKKHDKNGLFTLILFDHEYDIIHHSRPLEEIEPLNDQTYQPRGTTALHDAVGITLTKALASFKGKDASVKPSGVTVAILTDGLENASKQFDSKQVAALIDEAREQHGWEFVFLAANQDAVLAASELHIPAADAVNFDASKEGVHLAMHDMSAFVSERRKFQKGQQA